MKENPLRCPPTCQLCSWLPPRGLQVVVHPLVVGEHGSGGSDLGTHVADGAHACSRAMGSEARPLMQGCAPPGCCFAEQLARDSWPLMQACTPPGGLPLASGVCAARLGTRAVHQHRQSWPVHWTTGNSMPSSSAYLGLRQAVQANQMSLSFWACAQDVTCTKTHGLPVTCVFCLTASGLHANLAVQGMLKKQWSAGCCWSLEQ